MVSPVQDFFSSAAKSHLENQLAIWNALNVKTFDGLEKLIHLNLNAMKNALEESSARARTLMSTRNSLDFFSLVAAQLPTVDKFIPYSNDLANITAQIRDEFLKATQVEVSTTNAEVANIIGSVTEKEAESLKNMVQMTKSTVENAEDSPEQDRTSKAAKRDTPSKRASHHVAAHHQTTRNKKASAGASKKTTHH